MLLIGKEEAKCTFLRIIGCNSRANLSLSSVVKTNASSTKQLLLLILMFWNEGKTLMSYSEGLSADAE